MNSNHPDRPADTTAHPPIARARATASLFRDKFDVPIILSLAFWTSLFGILLERSQVLLTTLKSTRPLAGFYNYFIYSVGSFLLNFSVLICSILIMYYLLSGIKTRTAIKRIISILASIFAVASAATALSGLILQTTVIIFLSSQLMALCAVSVLLVVALWEARGRMKMMLIILPVLTFLFLQINQIHFFFPHLIPPLRSISIPAVFLVTGQVIFLMFAALTACIMGRWNRRNGLPLFIPFLISVSVLFVSIISILGPEKAKINFFRIIEVQYIFPYSYCIYPLVFSLIVFSFSLLLASYPGKFETRVLRLRSGYALGFVTMGTFTPATCYEITFLLLGMILWIHTVTQWKDL